MKTQKKHYVIFSSPGTMFNETTRKPIETWDTSLACSMAKTISERHGAKPFAFTFETMIEAQDVVSDDGVKMEIKPQKHASSANYFLGGEILTYEQLEARANPDESILRSNMRCNGMPLVIENRNSRRSTNEFKEADCVVDQENGSVVRRGSDADLVEYRAKTLARWEADRSADR